MTSSPAPIAINGNRLRWWNRLAWRLGLVPFNRCPNGDHYWRRVGGDERMANGYRPYRCDVCATREQPAGTGF